MKDIFYCFSEPAARALGEKLRGYGREAVEVTFVKKRNAWFVTCASETVLVGTEEVVPDARG